MLLLNVQLARNLYIFARLKKLCVLHQKNTAKPATMLHFRRIFAVQNEQFRTFIFRIRSPNFQRKMRGFL